MTSAPPLTGNNLFSPVHQTLHTANQYCNRDPAAMDFKLAWIAQLLLAFYAYPSLGFHHALPRDINQKPTQVIGGVTVINTPL